ncbi:unnamed protein product [Cladocopium goreaui]|uniref:Uncharacterized protein n=1 Tax=Cladocopium goreaui TaxID=2562237 RepID=A0A9P1DIR3_9DINO|nr:unnamed protein product [Cladocopium goreaui]
MEKSEQNSRSQEMEQSERHSQRMPAMHHSKEKNDESLHAANRSELENVTEHKEQRYSSNRAQSRSRSAPREDNEKEARSQSLGLPHSRRARRPHHRRRYTRMMIMMLQLLSTRYHCPIAVRDVGEQMPRFALPLTPPLPPRGLCPAPGGVGGRSGMPR